MQMSMQGNSVGADTYFDLDRVGEAESFVLLPPPFPNT
jgi:hypothetical protein